jgi:DNA-binding MarR family transcriptional regulator
VKLWLFLIQTSDLLRACTDQLFRKYKMTSEQYDVLVSVKYLGDRVNMTDMAAWLRRSPNSVSMLVDRMVKAGLVRRTRDRRDRRVVYVTATSKGEDMVGRANPTTLELIQELLSPLSPDDRGTFLNLFRIVERRALEYLNPGKNVDEMIKDWDKRHAGLMKRVPSYARAISPRAKHHGKKQGKTV